MDYLEKVEIIRHESFDAFLEFKSRNSHSRLVLSTTKGEIDYRDFKFEDSDYLLFGRESSGVSPEVLARVDEKVIIKMKNDARSLNLAVACGIILAAASA